MSLFSRLLSSKKKLTSVLRPRQARPALEALESRLVPYAASSNAWPAPQLITIGFVPDGTAIGGTAPSNLVATLNAKFGSAATWQNQILKAAQSWAQQTNLNFAVLTDNGADIGTGLYEQGDPNMADIRVGGYSFGNSALAQAYMPPPVNNTSYAGDVQFNTGLSWSIGTVSGSYDLYTVAAHEIGHSLGLYHSGIVTSAMYANYTTAKTALGSDDIAGIRSIYSASAARSLDAFDAAAGNTSFDTAADVSSKLDSVALSGVVNSLDITTAGAARYYKVTVPAGTTGALTLQAQSKGLSLLAPKMTVYLANQPQGLLGGLLNVVATLLDGTQVTQAGAASAPGTTGGTATVSLTGVTAGQVYYAKVQGNDNTAFGTGAFALGVNCGSGAMPAVTPPNTQVLASAVPNIGGGQAISLNPQFQVDTSNTFAQQTNSATPGSVAMDANGNYAVVWSSQGEDGSGWGVYARLYHVNGAAYGPAFRVNTTTQGDQTYPAVAMDAAGDFVVTWSSQGQDGSGWGVYAQRYAAGGVAQGGEFRVNTTTAGDQMWSSVAADQAGDFVITWSSQGQDGSGWGVYAQRYSAAGVAQGGEFQVNTTTAGDQMNSVVAMDQAGDFVIAWSSAGPGGWNIDAQRYSAGGAANGGELQVNSSNFLAQVTPALAINGTTGAFVATWSALNMDNLGFDVYFRIYNGQGAAQGSQSLVAGTMLGNQLSPAVAMDGHGNFLITWSSRNLGTTGWSVLGQQYDTNGNALGTQFRVSSNMAGNQQSVSVAMDSYGDAVAVWTGKKGNAASSVSGQRFLLNGGLGQAAGAASDGMNPDGTEPPPHGPGCSCALCQRLNANLAGSPDVQIVDDTVTTVDPTVAVSTDPNATPATDPTAAPTT